MFCFYKRRGETILAQLATSHIALGKEKVNDAEKLLWALGLLWKEGLVIELPYFLGFSFL